MDKYSVVPLYYQLKQLIIDKIESGILVEGDKLPSEREICDDLEISRTTVRKAIQELENEGYIYKIHGKGTYIAEDRIKQNLSQLYSFSNEMIKIGKKPSSKTIGFEIIKSDARISKKLNIEEKSNIYLLRRLRFADDEPMMIETTFIPYNKYKGLNISEIEEQGLYNVLIKKYNAKFNEAREIFQSVITNSYEEKLLNYREGLPSMMIERYITDKDITIFSKVIARGDKYKYEVKLK